MADTMQFDLVSPERRLASVQASEVQLPGTEGDMTAMPDHAPTITTLRPGIIRVVGPDGTDEYAVTSGFAEITASSAIVLAEKALHVSEVSQDTIDDFVREAHQAHEAAKDTGDHGLVDDTAKFLSDMVAMGGRIGLEPKQP